MTWWAALLGFVGALAGSWGGQLIVTKREDRRWEREREREELRWERERETTERKHEHDARMHWREKRLEAYSALDSAIMNFYTSCTKGIRERSERPMQRSKGDPAYLSLLAIGVATSAVRIIGSSDVISHSKKVYDLAGKKFDALCDDDLSKADQLMDLMDEQHEYLEDAFRVDLSVAAK